MSSRSVCRAHTTPCSLISGAWGFRWWRWRLVASPSHHLMLRSWSKSLAFPWRVTPHPVTPPPNPGPLDDLAAVSVQMNYQRKLQPDFGIFIYFTWLLHIREPCVFLLFWSIRTWQQTSDGHLWAAWLHCQWGIDSVLLVRLLGHGLALNELRCGFNG